MERRYANPYVSFRDHWNYHDVGEDCLRLNVFTPGLGGAERRPVLVWLHRGGFFAGRDVVSASAVRNDPDREARKALPPP